MSTNILINILTIQLNNNKQFKSKLFIKDYSSTSIKNSYHNNILL